MMILLWMMTLGCTFTRSYKQNCFLLKWCVSRGRSCSQPQVRLFTRQTVTCIFYFTFLASAAPNNRCFASGKTWFCIPLFVLGCRCVTFVQRKWRTTPVVATRKTHLPPSRLVTARRQCPRLLPIPSNPPHCGEQHARIAKTIQQAVQAKRHLLVCATFAHHGVTQDTAFRLINPHIIADTHCVRTAVTSVKKTNDLLRLDAVYTTGRNRSASSRQSDDARSGVSGSRGAWRQAHALRRRLDRVNKTASLVSYEERAQSGVPRAKAQRVRRRMHYAMSLQCFQVQLSRCCCVVYSRSCKKCVPGISERKTQGVCRLFYPCLMFL